MTDSTPASPVTFGEFLKFLRRRMQMTQQELGIALGYSISMVARLENGERLPDPALVKTTYVAALGLQHEPELAARLVELAVGARNPMPAAQGTTHVAPHILPTPLTSFIGREQDIASALQLLRRTDVRLITLLGPPGVGKTRLAIEVARAVREGFRDGVCLVLLASLSDPGLVPVAITQALGLATSQADSLTGVKLHLRDKQMLLVLDNLEHLMQAAPMIAEVLEAAPHVKVLATSRAALRLSPEFGVEVPPLDEVSSTELFAARAATVKPGFTLIPDNRATIGDICRRLDGLPLAIELAAARLRLFNPQSLLVRLAGEEVSSRSSLNVLGEGPRDLPERQRTLRNTVAWSYALLTPSQQRLLRLLSVLAGGCSLPAAQAVAGAPATFDADLQALLDSSLVQHHEGPDGEPRLSLLEMIREYAAEQLVACGEVEEAGHRHAAFYTSLVLWAPGMRAQREWPDAFPKAEDFKAWLSRLELEYANLRAALTWSLVGAHAADSGAELAYWLFFLWINRAPWHEALYWLEQALAQVNVCEHSLTRARLLISLARFVGAVSNPARALDAAREALAIFKSLRDESGINFALYILTDVELERNDLAAAQVAGEEWLTFARETAGDVTSALFYQGDIALCRKDFPQAAARLEETLRVEPGIPAVWNIQGTLACYLGDYSRATALCEEALAGMRAHPYTHGIATVLHSLGDIALFHGDAGQAGARFAEALRLFGENGNRQRSVWCLGGLAALEAVTGHAARAVTLWAAAEALHVSIGSPRPALRVEDYRQRVEAARVKLDARAGSTAAAAGSAMSFVQAVEYALQGSPAEAEVDEQS